jgi:maltooligosyltrehalose trehalohydrolase
MTALWLLTSARPMLFQGQEFAASSPFCFFADHAPELSRQIRGGRLAFLRQFPSLAAADMRGRIPDPADPKVFERCKLDFSQRASHAGVYALHRDLLRLRREHPVFRRAGQGTVDGALLAAEAFLLRFFGAEDDDRLLLVNFGADLHLDPAPEPLLAPPAGRSWQLLWSSENPAYGGSGTPPPESDDNWRIPAQATIVMIPEKVP